MTQENNPDRTDDLAKVLLEEYGCYFDRSEGAVSMAVRLIRQYVPPCSPVFNENPKVRD